MYGGRSLSVIISDFKIDNRRERLLPLLVGAVCYVLCAITIAKIPSATQGHPQSVRQDGFYFQTKMASCVLRHSK